MAKHNVRLLVDQTTGFVVWLSYNFDSYPPIVDPTLNYHTFNSDTDVNLFPAYSDFKLYYSYQKKTFTEGKTLSLEPAKFVHAQLLRAKAVTLYHAISIVKHQYERADLLNENLYKSLDTVVSEEDPWVQIYQREYNCNTTEALKLIKFHVAEHETAIFNLESALLIFKNKARAVNTLSDLIAEYNMFCNKMIATPFNLKKLTFIYGPL